MSIITQYKKILAAYIKKGFIRLQIVTHRLTYHFRTVKTNTALIGKRFFLLEPWEVLFHMNSGSLNIIRDLLSLLHIFFIKIFKSFKSFLLACYGLEKEINTINQIYFLWSYLYDEACWDFLIVKVSGTFWQPDTCSY